MCESSPVRKLLGKWTVRQIEQARERAAECERNAKTVGDHGSAVVYRMVVEDCNSEIQERLKLIAARQVMRESVK